MTDLHVVPDQRTTWRVYEPETPAPLSEHTNATDAERAAQARAEDHGAARVVVHDRYNRTHDLDSRPNGSKKAPSAPAPADSTPPATAHAGPPASNDRNAAVWPTPGSPGLAADTRVRGRRPCAEPAASRSPDRDAPAAR